MIIKEINNANYLNLFTDVLANKEETILFGVADDYVVLKGNNCINEDYCKKHNLDVYNSSHMGGCIILGKGDVEFNIFRYNGWQDGKEISGKILEYLQSRIENISIQENDFLVDGQYKVGSFSSINTGNNFIYTGFHFSVNVNIEHIKNICTKPMNKIPKGLSEYGITTEDILNLLGDISAIAAK